MESLFSHFGSSHFFSSFPLLTRGGQVALFLLLPARRRSMPRRGWLPASDGWVQILRGPRPPSENWPMRCAPPPRAPIEARSRAGRWRQPQGVSVPPEVAMQVARKRVEGIEAALGALAAVGTVDGPEVQMLKECLAKAKRSAQERPFAQQISHTESCLERAKKRLTAHDAARQQFVTDVQESEARLKRLRALAAADSVPRPRVFPESGNQVQCLQQMVNQLQEERDALVRELRGDIVERPRVRQRLFPTPTQSLPCPLSFQAKAIASRFSSSHP